MSTLDLRKNGRLTIDDSKLITKIEPKIRKEYNEYIGELAKSNNVNGIDWLLQTLNRNTYVTQIYDRFLRLALLSELLKKGNIYQKIIIDDESMRIGISQIIDNELCIIIVLDEPSNFKNLILLNFLKNTYYMMNLWLWPKIFRKDRRPKEKIIYVDSFVDKNCFDSNGDFSDYTYPGLLEAVPENIRGKIWYAPVIDGVKSPLDFIRIFRKIRKSNTNLILKEDILRFSDYIQAIYLSVILPKKIKNIPLWRDIDISNIIFSELKAEIGSTLLSNAILIYLSISRLKQSGLEVELVIDWFENQTIDRGVCLGFHDFYPDIYIKGYQGYVVPDIFACQQPTTYEFDARIIPDEICVIGSAYVDERKKFCPDLYVSVAPAFRFQQTINFKNKPNVKKDKVLLALPVRLDDCRDIINLCLGINAYKGYKFVIKQHPSYSREKLIELLPELKDQRFTFSDKSLTELFNEAAILVSNSSSVCIEAVLCGLFVVIVGSRSGPAMNPLLGSVPDEYWSLCYTSECIEKILSRDNSGYSLESAVYLHPVTNESVSRFLRL